MAKLSADKTYVTVEKGDTLSEIARDYGNGLSYTQLARINEIENANFIAISQKIMLTGKSSKKTTDSNKVTIKAFGIQSNTDNILFVTWSWSKSHTDKYEVEWYYYTGDKAKGKAIWFVGSKTSTEDRQSTYTIPANAKQVRVRIKPISKTHKVNKKDTKYWTANWSNYSTFNVKDTPPIAPSTPTVEVDKFKLTASLDNLDVNADEIQFQVAKDDNSIYKTGKKEINKTNHVSFSCTITAGHEYKVRARSYKDGKYSDWSDYSGNVITIPKTPKKITVCRANTETSVYLEWTSVKSAETYDIEYSEKKEYFDITDQTNTKTGINLTKFEVTGLESGKEYFFRVRAVNSKGTSSWTGIKSSVVGSRPSAPTTWSSSTTIITGEQLTLYWVHNSKDGSSETKAELEIYINGKKETHTITKSTSEEEKDKTSSYPIDTSKLEQTLVEGNVIEWRVRTSGITNKYGEWSIQRIIDVYSPPTLELSVNNVDGDPIDTVTSFPIYVSGLAGPSTQSPIGYHLSIKSKESYKTVDSIGNVKMVNKDEEIYSKYFDVSTQLLVELSAGNIDLENNIEYEVICVVSMNSGLTAEESVLFNVYWEDEFYSPNAEVSFDPDTLVANISPYCKELITTQYKVVQESESFITTDEIVDVENGIPLELTPTVSVYTTTGEEVYYGKTKDNTDVYYCEKSVEEFVEGVTLSVYRREFDGTFTEIETNIENGTNTVIPDPHPSLDYARYRVVSTTKSTGAVKYYDLPGIPTGESSIVIQWDEEWTNFNTTNEDELEQPPWTGSLLKLPYNVDTSSSYNPDISTVNYVGREHPVSYYGTQKGETASWKADIDANDKDTLYALRRLAIYMGDVYVREPSGSGYWATINVSFSKTHCELTIPVTLNITRVEGGK